MAVSDWAATTHRPSSRRGKLASQFGPRYTPMIPQRIPRSAPNGRGRDQGRLPPSPKRSKPSRAGDVSDQCSDGSTEHMLGRERPGKGKRRTQQLGWLCRCTIISLASIWSHVAYSADRHGSLDMYVGIVKTSDLCPTGYPESRCAVDRTADQQKRLLAVWTDKQREFERTNMRIEKINSIEIERPITLVEELSKPVRQCFSSLSSWCLPRSAKLEIAALPSLHHLLFLQFYSIVQTAMRRIEGWRRPQ